MATKARQDRGQRDQAPSAVSAAQGIHVVAKPIGPVCNLNCEYCFYLEKQGLFATDEKYRMSDNIDSKQLTTMSRGFSIFALDTRNPFSTFASICGPWRRCWTTASLHHACWKP